MALALIVAARRFLSPANETSQQFGSEWKKLTEQDKQDLKVLFAAAGVETV